MSRRQVTPDHRPVAVVSPVAGSVREGADGADGAEILQSIAEAALEAVPGADTASICVVHPDGSTDRLAAAGELPDGLGVGAVSQLTCSFFRAGSTRVTITLSSARDDNLEDSRQIAELFAAQAAMTMNFARTTETLQAALVTRQVIGQAVGIVMERYHLDEERAFGYLVRQSQDSNTKLRAVAQETVDGHNRQAT